MSNKAVSKKFKCHKHKIGIDRNPYVQVDIDRLIGYMKQEIEKIEELIKSHEGTVYEEHPVLLKDLEHMKDNYEGLLSMIEANSFR